ncbi:penicillin-binding transpeptidase domain-containing protein [Streptomyces sp. VRA16 Mangrove soil]|uniref:penicillin-binding transpeptidase domain-containing protein n=1 Tax=Streptomyces sp. VRA16 Mangrove soil TaxID=2817434 RepID=UPI001A9EF6A9|nr:penicillin-binding transpeptidase domain-containing protein [Streptomyces sp. VRA16 Mangrove soil]MBO1330637.1 penicillin-binding protein [Streptomyces sp. VRA16 Mangrove soil]
MGDEGQGTGRKRALWIGGCVAAVALGAGGWALVAPGDPEPRTGPLSAAEVRSATDGFLKAWSDGDTDEAADRTDDATAAAAALRDYRDRAHLTPVHLTAGAPKGARVPLSVRAEFTFKGAHAPVSYDSALTVVRRAGDGRAVVDWRPAVLHPRLGDGGRLDVRETSSAPVRALDRDGRALDLRAFPSLARVAAGLRQTYGAAAGGRPAVELRAPGGDVLAAVPEGAPGKVRTTIDARVQKAAEREVALRSGASLVVVRPSTGEILAVADSRPQGPDTALEGRLAPGSTMKMITASLLLEKKLAAPDKPHPCPKNASYGGWKFHNVDDFDIVGGTFRSSFAASCNTAFITQAGRIADDALSRQARDVFGIGERWSVGVDAFPGAVPVEHAASKAASLIGQGEVRMNPMTMASVVSTARTGQFHQPYLVAPSVDHRTLATARRTLDATAHAQLRDLLHTTATSGSASGAMAGLHGDIGAKTGSAEVIGQEKPNGWFAAWHGDLAASAVMRGAGRGGESSGPLVAAVLKAADSS